MSLHSSHDDDGGSSLRPRPRRPFELSSTPPSPASGSPAPSEFHTSPGATSPTSHQEDGPPSRSRSILNLTSSTLLGIYQPTGYSADRDEPATPWGTGAMTPSSEHPSFDLSREKIPDTILQRGKNGELVTRRKSTVTIRRPPKAGFRGYYLPLFGRTIALFTAGVLYGLLISRLHDRPEMSPVKVDVDRARWQYSVYWGLAGVFLGETLPYIDQFWAPEHDDEAVTDSHTSQIKIGRGVGAWSDVVRSVGIFVGVAFAIRKLPWQSTLQLSATLALTNPAIWYLIDRSPSGLIMSLLVSLAGTPLLLAVNPHLLPSPSPVVLLQDHVKRFVGLNSSSQVDVVGQDLLLGLFSLEAVGVVTWIASVLFVSTVCFGNIGRRLASKT